MAKSETADSIVQEMSNMKGSITNDFSSSINSKQSMASSNVVVRSSAPKDALDRELEKHTTSIIS